MSLSTPSFTDAAADTTTTADTAYLKDSPMTTAPTHTEPRPATMASRTMIELRKLVDTRSSAVLLWVTLGLTLLMFGVAFALSGKDATFSDVVGQGSFPLLYLLPIVGILAVASEWRYDTALWTYSLDPARTKVLVAKFAAVLALALGTVVLTALLGLAVMAAKGLPMPDVAETLSVLGNQAVGVGGMTLLGTGLGAALMAGPLAIVLFLLAPQMVPQLLNISEKTSGLVPYVDAQNLLFDRLAGEPWPAVGQIVSNLVVWFVIPIGIGIWRNARRDA